MSSRQAKTVTYTGMRGRDGFSVWPGEIPKTRALEMVNVDLYRASFARKRGGSSTVFSGTTNQAFTGVMSFIGRHVPGADPTAAELWGIDAAATPVVQRLAGGTAWSTPTLKDAITGTPQDVVGVSFNGKYFLAYKSAVDRLHCWDTATVRRAGLATPAAATVADTGSGTYAATKRYYRTAYAILSGSVRLFQSEESPSVSFTTSGSGNAARVTKPASIVEGETHWILYGSADDQVYYELAVTAVGTTTYDDVATPADYASNDADPLIGSHVVWSSVKYLMATDDHLIGAGSYEGGKSSRVWWSGVTGQTRVGDDESVITTLDVSNYADLNEHDGGDITGVGGPLGTYPIIFKRNQVWKLVPTGTDNPFYRPVPVFKGSGLGCIRHQTIVMAEDAAGRPAIYWLDEQGPYRMGSDGPQCLVDDIQDLWDTVNLSASSVVAHGVYYPKLKQIWWWIATGTNNSPDTKIVFDIRKGRPYEDGRVRDGWLKHDGVSAAAQCSCLFSTTLGASMARTLKPYIGKTSGTVLLQCDTSATDDAGTAFQAYVDLPDTHFGGIGNLCLMSNPILIGSAGSQSLAVSMVRDYGTDTLGPSSVSMAAAGSEARVLRVVEAIEAADAGAIRVRVGDAAAVSNGWTLDAVTLLYERREEQ